MRAFIFCWLFSLTTLAASPPLSPSVFQTQVRPQLVGIDQDIQQIFLAMPGYPPQVLRAMDLVDQLLKQTQLATPLCPRELTTNCMPQIQQTLLLLRELDRLWLMQEIQAKPSTDASVGTLMGGRRWLQLSQTNLELKAGLEASALSLAAKRRLEILTMWHWKKLASEIDNWLNLLVIEYVPVRLQEDFRSAWMNFFLPLRRQAILANNPMFVTTNLDSLNFYWNLLNVKLTKRLKKTPDGMQAPLNAIQNRWNQVMRICFGK